MVKIIKYLLSGTQVHYAPNVLNNIEIWTEKSEKRPFSNVNYKTKNKGLNRKK